MPRVSWGLDEDCSAGCGTQPTGKAIPSHKTRRRSHSPTEAPHRLATLQPVIGLKLAGCHVLVDWGWQGHGYHLDMIELQVVLILSSIEDERQNAGSASHH